MVSQQTRFLFLIYALDSLSELQYHWSDQQI